MKPQISTRHTVPTHDRATGTSPAKDSLQNHLRQLVMAYSFASDPAASANWAGHTLKHHFFCNYPPPCLGSAKNARAFPQTTPNETP